MAVVASAAERNSHGADPLAVRHSTRLAAASDHGARFRGPGSDGGVAAATRLALCKAALLAGTPLRLRIRGSSMVPALWPGESVSVHPTDMKGVRVGQIVVFSRDGNFVAHRVVRIDPSADGAAVTRGDAACEEDAPIDASEWLGTVAAVHRFGAPRTPRLAPTRLARAMAALVRDSGLLRRALDRLSMLPARTANAHSPHARSVDGFRNTPPSMWSRFRRQTKDEGARRKP